TTILRNIPVKHYPDVNLHGRRGREAGNNTIMSTRAAITIRGLTKRYGRLTAVRDLDLDVEVGEVFGFLGVNGAGKSTTIRILLDFVRPTAGRASILGHDCQRAGLAARAAVGYLPGELGFYEDMTGDAVLD